MKLKEFRLKNGYTQREIAKMLKMTPSGYGFYEAERSEPNIETLTTLANLYHVSLDELIGREFNIQISDSEQELLDYIRQLSPIDQGKVLGYAKSRVEFSKQQQERELYFKLKNNNKGE